MVEDFETEEPEERDDDSSEGAPPDEYPTTWFGSASDEDKLAAFVVAVHNDVSVVVDLRRELFAPVRESSEPQGREVLEAMHDAWREAQQSVPSIVAYVLAPTSRATLEGVGLTGRQLDFKILAWDQARRSLLRSFADSDGPEPASPPPDIPAPGLRSRFARLVAKVPRARKRALRGLAKVLGYADVILDSLASVLQIAEPLKEFKQMTERLAQDTSEALPNDKS